MSFTVCTHHGLAGAELVVGVTGDSNSSSRNFCSELGGRITLDGAGGSLGQLVGVASREVVAQLEIAITQASNNSSSDGRGLFLVLLMLGSNGGQSIGLFMFGGARGLLTGQGAEGSSCLLFAGGHVSRSVAPFPASPEAEHQRHCGDCEFQLDRHAWLLC
ncbi:hypothetical protein BE73_14125 [Xanthomonas oryzae pv. oryzicola]|nr:hypothetical protein BE73_14125 [Xanthomonas oryzae pv. oryzicola]